MLLERFPRHPPNVTDRPGAELLQSLAGVAPHAPQAADRQGIEKLLHAGGVDDDKAIGLLQIAGDLGQELVLRHADRGHKANALADLGLDSPGNLDRRAEERLASCYVDEGF